MKVAPQSGMKVKWQSVYWPIGEWINETGEAVDIVSGFRAKDGDREILVVMNNNRSSPGHGEPSITAPTPSYIDAASLDSLPAPRDFIEIK
ncbi:hypothetical protein Pcaca05_05110 [Pectobacterium carotovorum subsp. carotovorum]|nr:hypothetical protein Pcaca05_05110 [Pectobacterium carotovorum subsp. carotovorum]